MRLTGNRVATDCSSCSNWTSTHRVASGPVGTRQVPARVGDCLRLSCVVFRRVAVLPPRARYGPHPTRNLLDVRLTVVTRKERQTPVGTETRNGVVRRVHALDDETERRETMIIRENSFALGRPNLRRSSTDRRSSWLADDGNPRSSRSHESQPFRHCRLPLRDCGSTWSRT